MATVVLTAVGTAIAGPIGGAIGAAIGQSIDRNVIFRPKGREGPRLAELAVQTSSYGTQVPRLFGTMRVAGSVIWATELIERRSHSGGGKGQPTVTGYSYSASFAVALSSRPILRVGRIWADGKLLRGAAGDWKSTTGFRLHTGGEDQEPDPLIASAEGRGLAPAHRGIAYAVFEELALEDFGNRIPSLTFEVTADPAPLSTGAIAAAIGEGVLVDAGAGVMLDGFSAYGGSARGVIETLAQAGGAWFAPVGDAIEMRGALSEVVTVADSGAAGAGRARTIRPVETVPRTIVVGHYDPARDYQTGAQRATRPGAGDRRETVDVPAVIDADGAKTIATALLARAEADRVRRRVATDLSAIGIGPGDGVAIAGESGRWRVTGATLEGMAVSLDLAPVAPAILPATATPGRALGAPDEMAGTTILHAFETPALDEALLTEPRLTIVAAGTAAGWRRAALSYSLDDGASWIAAGGTAAAGIAGALAAPLPPGPVTLIDRRHTIEVTLAHDAMALTGADAAAMDRGANLALIGDELVQFGGATQTGAARWRLSHLLRGRRATPVGRHGAGSRFVLIEAATALTLSIPAGPGRMVRIRAIGTGDGGAAAETAVRLGGASILPPAPVHLAATDLPDGGARAGWRRRSRAGWRWRDGADVPLGEESESYRVAVIPTRLPGRIVTTGAAGVVVSAAERAGGPVAIEIVQLGANGASPAAGMRV